MNLVDLLKKNVVMIPVVASLVVGTFTGVKYIVSLTETINKNQAAITIINEKDLKNQIDYISQLTNNQNNLLMRVEREKGNNDIIQDKIKIMEQKIRELDLDFKRMLMNRTN
jgi:peptidoglycan hydrolase CwlO-like protein|tara:strand:- start:582 stop:917 length:336 start_codon:yes stop_codon:yes gene_type:complete